MTTPSTNAVELSRKVVTYLEHICPRPPGRLRRQDYLTGDDANDAPVLRGVAAALGLTVWQLFERAEAHVPVAPVVKRRACSTGSTGDVCVVRVKSKRVAARVRREPAAVVATCVGGERC
jgi:hypothetical protein